MVAILSFFWLLHKLYKFRRRPQKLRSPVPVFVPTGEIFPRGPEWNHHFKAEMEKVFAWYFFQDL